LFARRHQNSGELLGTPAQNLDDSIPDTFEFEDAPAEYAERPEIKDRLDSFAETRGGELQSLVESADSVAGSRRTLSAPEGAFGKRIRFVSKEGLNPGAIAGES
jgi:hypothetical protein